MMSHLSINSTVLNSSLEIPHSVYRYIRRFTFPLVSIVPSWAMHHIKSEYAREWRSFRSAVLYVTCDHNGSGSSYSDESAGVE